LSIVKDRAGEETERETERERERGKHFYSFDLLALKLPFTIPH
jgi:hypothetical protein